MKSIPKGIWEFSILLLLLLMLAAGAAWSTIESIQSLLMDVFKKAAAHDVDRVSHIITIAILALTMGFLFLAGALGLWAIRSTSERESRRRIGRFVDAMNYLRDGLIALDRKGRINGSNPAARTLMAIPPGTTARLRDAFPALSDEDVERLLKGSTPDEVERTCRTTHGAQTVRFRSQPSDDMDLVLVSDVTDQRNIEMQHRQITQLQLIGRIAGGVAHDFNNILCAISAHAALIERGHKVTSDEKNSLEAILHESQRGAVLANHLLELSRTGVKGDPCDRVAEHVVKAADLLRVGLSVRWEVRVDIEGTFRTIPLTSVQLEQVLVNLSLLVADEFGKEGLLRWSAAKPDPDIMMGVDEHAEIVLTITAHTDKTGLKEDTFIPQARETAQDLGVIPSVVRSMIEELGGHITTLEGPGRRHGYRISLPHMSGNPNRDIVSTPVPEVWRTRLNGWKVLVALSGGRDTRLNAYLRELDIKVVEADNLVGALQYVQNEPSLHGIIMDKVLLGTDARPLLRAIVKLHPTAAFVLFSDKDEPELLALKGSLSLLKGPTSPENTVQALLLAKERT